MPNHPDLRALEVIYRYRLDDVGASAKLPRTALTVALRAEGETIGSLAAISRSAPTGFPETTTDALENLARRAGPAVWSAMRFVEAREQADSLADRPAQPARLLRVPWPRDRPRPPLRAVRLVDRVRPRRLQADQRPDRPPRRRRRARRGRRVRPQRRPRDRHPLSRGRRRVRSGPARVEPRRCRTPADRIAIAIRAQKVEKIGALKISAGVAELRPEDTPADLFKRADHALLRAKNAGKARVVAS